MSNYYTFSLRQFISFLCFLIAGHLSAQLRIESKMQTPQNFVSDSIVSPPSPLWTQVLFIGGHDLVQTNSTYKNPKGRAIAKEGHDFIGFTADSAGQSLGWISINHELNYKDDRLGDGGGMTAFRVKRLADGNLDVVDQTLKDGRSGKFFNVDFVNTVGETGMNCSGIRSPNGRIWTAEEWFKTDNASIFNGEPNTRAYPIQIAGITTGQGIRDTADMTIKSDIKPWNDKKIKKYQNFNWFVEIDPKQAVAIRKQYNWGRAGWESGAISNDLKTVYFGNDEAPTAFFKFEAKVANQYQEGDLFFYKHDHPKKWIKIPYETDIYLQNVNDYAVSHGATMFLRNEWVAVDPKTDMVYWTETGRDEGGKSFAFGTKAGGIIHPHHQKLAKDQKLPSANDPAYLDLYGRVWYYDPKTMETGVAVSGGPGPDPASKSYPENHLANPDGLTTIVIDGHTFLVICEDLNGYRTIVYLLVSQKKLVKCIYWTSEKQKMLPQKI
ncbi:MAG: DUF839 domain-containing protein [Saprospiraceae bacterium]|nr:DUF839 domain-containing protein [Saprospiraceae bacterium]